MTDQTPLTDAEEVHYARRAEDREARHADRQQDDADRAYMRNLAIRRQRKGENDDGMREAP